MFPLMILCGSAALVQVISLWLQRHNLTYHSHPHYHAILYALGTLIAFQTHPQTLHHPALQWSYPLGILWAALTLAIVAFNHRWPIPFGYRVRHKNSYFLNFNPAFVLVKICDIFFQQAFLVTFILILFGYYPQTSLVATITFLTFVAAHLPLAWSQRKVSVLHLVGAGLFIGIVPFAILNIQSGFWWVWYGHWCFYIAIRLLMAIKPLRRSLLGQDVALPSAL